MGKLNFKPSKQAELLDELQCAAVALEIAQEQLCPGDDLGPAISRLREARAAVEREFAHLEFIRHD